MTKSFYLEIASKEEIIQSLRESTNKLIKRFISL